MEIPVRGVTVPDDARDPSCFVGDLVGDYREVSDINRLWIAHTLSARAVVEGLEAGVGLAAFILLLFAVGSITLCLLTPPKELDVLGARGFAIPPFGGGTGFLIGFGVGWSIMTATVGRTNMPRPGGQSKYLWP